MTLQFASCDNPEHALRTPTTLRYASLIDRRTQQTAPSTIHPRTRPGGALPHPRFFWVRGGEAPPQVELTNRLSITKRYQRYQKCYYPLAEVRGPPTAAMPWCRIYAEGALLSVTLTAGTPPEFPHARPVPLLRRLANGYGQGVPTRLVLGTRGLKLGPEFPPRIARSRGIMIRVCRVWVSPPRIACLRGVYFCCCNHVLNIRQNDNRP